MDMATIIVSRKHVSGNLTLGIYTVDLLCMGISEALYRYNIPEIKLTTMIINSAKDIRFVEVPYKLVHNIIYAAIEYAEGYGFHPVAPFTRVAQYILEPDTEVVPMMNIRCGDRKGNPVLPTGGEMAKQQKHILDSLHQTVKHENYQYPYGENEKGEEMSEAKAKIVDKYSEIKQSYYAMSAEERKTQFIDFFDKLKCTDEKEQQKIFMPLALLSDVIIRNIAKDDKVCEFIETLKKNFNCKIIDMFNLPNSYFAGLQHRTAGKLAKEYRKITDKLASDNREQEIGKIREKYGDLPFISYLELKYDKNITPEGFREKLNILSQKFPDYLMFKIMQCQYVNHEKLETMLSKIHEPVTLHEFKEFLLTYAISCIADSDYPLEKIMAFESRVYEYKNSNYIPLEGLFITMSLVKMEIVQKYYGIGE
jgi:hypothetical protein